MTAGGGAVEPVPAWLVAAMREAGTVTMHADMASAVAAANAWADDHGYRQGVADDRRPTS